MAARAAGGFLLWRLGSVYHLAYAGHHVELVDEYALWAKQTGEAATEGAG